MLPFLPQYDIANHRSTYPKLPAKYCVTPVKSQSFCILSYVSYLFLCEFCTSILRSVSNWWYRLIESSFSNRISNVVTLRSRKQMTGIVTSPSIARVADINIWWESGFVEEIEAQPMHSNVFLIPQDLLMRVGLILTPKNAFNREFIKCGLREFKDCIKTRPILFFGTSLFSCRIELHLFGSPMTGSIGVAPLQVGPLPRGIVA